MPRAANLNKTDLSGTSCGVKICGRAALWGYQRRNDTTDARSNLMGLDVQRSQKSRSEESANGKF
jgi:hypothetical protein